MFHVAVCKCSQKSMSLHSMTYKSSKMCIIFFRNLLMVDHDHGYFLMLIFFRYTVKLIEE